MNCIIIARPFSKIVIRLEPDSETHLLVAESCAVAELDFIHI